MTTQSYPRTIEEARLDASYDVRINELHERFFGRLHAGCMLITLLASTAAFVSVVQSNGALAAVSGAVITAVGFADALLDFGGKASRFRAARQRYQRLLATGADWNLAKFDKALAELAIEDEVPIEALRLPAYNQNLRRHGRLDFVQPLSRWQQLMELLA